MLSEVERLALQNRVENFFVKNPEISKADAANYFIQEGICKEKWKTDNKEKCPEYVRFAGKEKFPKKILMWVAISERGMSKPLFRSSKSTAICSNVYIQECLEK